MERHSNGFYTFSDSYFKSMNKQDLINYIRTIEKNWENQLITNEIQYNNCKRLLVEERNKAITEFAERIEDEILTMFCSDREYQIAHKTLEEIAEELRGGV